jgi:16S rRNA (uracil1498-N3)-methyltransferase
MPRLYVDLELTTQSLLNLPHEVVRHIQVLRLRENQEITLFNGDGYNYQAKLLTLAKREAQVAITTKIPNCVESTYEVSLYMALIANDKFDLVVQKAVELGVTQIVPINCQHTQRFKAEKISAKLEHWQKIVIAASEQCGRSRLAQIAPPSEFSQALTQANAELKFILSPYHHSKLTPVQVASMALMIGPEGGFTAEEITLAVQAGFQPLKLGPRILRAETAAIAGLSLIQATYGDLIT